MAYNEIVNNFGQASPRTNNWWDVYIQGRPGAGGRTGGTQPQIIPIPLPAVSDNRPLSLMANLPMENFEELEEMFPIDPR